jgi:hypothetical protein
VARPLIQLGRLAEARRALTELLAPRSGASAPPSYDDRLNDIRARILWARLLAAEGNTGEAGRTLAESIQGGEALRASHSSDLKAAFVVSSCYRELAAITRGERRREALLHSAKAWHDWPATSFTKREEQRDLAAAGQ